MTLNLISVEIDKKLARECVGYSSTLTFTRRVKGKLLNVEFFVTSTGVYTAKRFIKKISVPDPRCLDGSLRDYHRKL